jgi:predicted RNA-binding Zn-ribbon protein involved in translation (DUF1610 family)
MRIAAMIKIRRSVECQRWQRFSRYLGDEYLVCAVHPLGSAQIPCPDFTKVTENWAPVGATYYNGELILDSPAYLTTAERLELIATHPLFTGECPSCGSTFAGAPAVHWDCPNCVWVDDGVRRERSPTISTPQ